MYCLDGKEAVEYFEGLLNGREEGVEEVHDGRERSGNKGDGLLGEDITREEVVWALRKLKVKAAAGKNGITAEMMNKRYWRSYGGSCSVGAGLVEWSRRCGGKV